MSMLYRNPNSSRGGLNSSQFVGNDPSLGVSVIRNRLEKYSDTLAAVKTRNREAAAPLEQVSEALETNKDEDDDDQIMLDGELDEPIQSQDINTFLQNERRSLDGDDIDYDNGDYQTVELYYQTQSTGSDEAEKSLGIKIDVLAGEEENRTMELQPTTRDMDLNMIFFADNRLNTLYMRFDYSFTQN